MSAPRSALAPTVALTLLFGAALTGCSASSPETPSCSRNANGGLTIAIGVHQNAPAAAIDADAACLVNQTLRTGNPISVVAIDGTSKALLRNIVIPVDNSDPDRYKADLDAASSAIFATIAGATADSDGSDTTAALGLISDLAASSPAHHTTVLVYDSMMPDRGLVNMTKPTWAKAAPGDVADYLTANGNEPHTKNTSWVLVGSGYTAPPQQPLPDAQRRRVTDIWTEVLRRGGADSVEAVPLPQQGNGPDTKFTTGTVAVDTYAAPPPPCTAAPFVFDNNSPVGFLSDSTELIDPNAATKALNGIGQWLAAYPARRASVVGTTANVGDLTGQRQLGARRAATVVKLISEQGGSLDQLSSVGVGSDFLEYVLDTNDPAAKQANRSVRITLSGPSTC